MNTKEYLEGSLRPYVTRSDFDMHYPISYQPSIGIVDNSTSQSISQSLPFLQSQSNRNLGIRALGRSRPLVSKSSLGLATASGVASSSGTDSYGKSVGDMEWKEFFDWNNIKAIIVGLTRRFIQGWLKCLISQPFDVVRVLLQVGGFKGIRKATAKLIDKRKLKDAEIHYGEEDSDDDSGRDAYFGGIEDSPSRLRESRIERTPIKGSGYNYLGGQDNKLEEKMKKVSVKIEPVTLNTFDMLNALMAKEGPRGILKAVNTTFLMNTLQYTIESWISGFISGLLGIPDPLFVEMIHSPNSHWSLMLSILSNVVAGLLLSQLRLIRMKFIITTSSKGCRSFREILWNLPRFNIFKIPKDLIIPNLITGLIKSLTVHYPDFLLTSMKISKYNSPYTYNTCSLLLKITGLFIRLPFETLYSRAQVNYLLTNKKELPEIMRVDSEDMCVEFGGYYGYLSTLYYILVGSKPVNYGDDNMFEQNVMLEIDNDDEENKGVQAIFRGWKVGLIRLVSSFTLNLLRDDRINLIEEKF